MTLRKLLRPLAAALCLASLAATSGGCFGKFAAFQKLRTWNEGLGNKWANWGVFLLLVIIPVYQLVWLGDVLIFNSVEFWTGSNPMAMKDGEVKEKLVLAEGRAIRMRIFERGARMTVEVDGELAFELRNSERGAVVVDGKERELARLDEIAELQGGALRVTSAAGAREVSADRVQALADAARQGRAAMAQARDAERAFSVAAAH
jgi:hypothetical protein